MAKTRRIIGVYISQELVIELLTRGYKTRGKIECTEGVPADAIYVGNSFDPMKNAVIFYFIHPSFKPIELGGLIPMITVTHTVTEP